MHPHNSNTKTDIIGKIESNDRDPDETCDYDDEIVLVSSTRERWEKLHGIDLQKKSQNDRDKKINRNNNDVHQANGDEDDIIVVTVKPTHTRPEVNISANFDESIYKRIIRGLLGFEGGDTSPRSRLQCSFQICFLFTGIALSIWATKRFLRKRKLGLTSKDKVDMNNTTALSTQVRTETEDDTADNNNVTRKEKKSIVITGLNIRPSVHWAANSSENLHSSENRKRFPKISQISQADSNQVSSMMMSSISSNMHERNGSIQKQTEKLEMARQLAKDILLVHDVLVENALDPSLAPQLAISLQSSQHIVDSQRDMCYKKAMLDAYQRQLDRQLSEQQHRESLRGAQYDPNWKEKLQTIRDQCYYWNALNGGVSRLWWEVLLIQQLARGIIPVWQRYLQDFHQFNANTNADMGVNYDGIGLLSISFLKDTTTSVFVEVCDCQLSSTTEQFTSTTMTGTESTRLWMIPTLASPIFSFNFDIGDTVSSSVLVFISLLKQVLPGPIEYWTCYGYCIMLASTLLLFTIFCHQGLRILSLPLSLHNIVNCASMILFYGPQRTLRLIFATLMRMVMVVPTTDYRDDDFHGPGSEEQEWQEQNRSSLIGCSFLLMSMWVFMPLFSWKRASTLYHESVLRVSRADPVNFEASFQSGTSRLKQWYWEQMAIRYLLLSMYSALVLWERSRIK